MEKNDLIAQLASRMNSNEMAASLWLEATMDVLNGVSKGQMPAANAVNLDHMVAGERDPGSAIPQHLYKGAKAHVETKPLLRPATATTRLSIDVDDVQMKTFPYRVGREARTHLMAKLPIFGERRHTRADPNNELYVRDMGRPLNVSREHFSIERHEDGSYELIDRGSACGTIVNGNVIGGEYTGGRCPLFDGDTIVVGTHDSGIAFEFVESP
ncbi:MAG: FHA domain-containing protein [Halioglobus sp.]